MKEKLLHFTDEIKRLEDYESKNFFSKLFSSNVSSEDEIAESLNNFIEETFINSINTLDDFDELISSFNWFISVKDFLYYENLFKGLDVFIELFQAVDNVANTKLYDKAVNIKRSIQLYMRENEKLNNMFEKYNIK